MTDVRTAPCTITTPEGVQLTFATGAAGDRIGAFLIDMLIIAGVLVAVMLAGLPLLLITDTEAGLIGLAVLNVAAFGLFNFYFIVSELTASGTTIGKRRMGLRVIARDGGPLTADMIVARNLMRDLEIYLPVMVVLAPQSLFGGATGWGVAVGLIWLLVLLFLPLFNRYRLRAGDLIAGTIVVAEPRSTLLPELAAAPAFDFAPAHLEHYGIHELQVLEDIVRKHARGQAAPELLAEISQRIKRRIGWPPERADVHPEEFLRAFYTAQRAHLERKLLFGKRKERKSDSGPTGA